MQERERKVIGIKTVSLMMLCIIILGLFSGLAIKPTDAGIGTMIFFDEIPIVEHPSSQQNPDIHYPWIVWQDNRNGNWDIYLWSFSFSEPEFQVTNNPAEQIHPAVHGNKFVWQDNRNGNWDIYMFDMWTETEHQITNNSASQEFPKIYGNYIVWQDNRHGNWDIYLYNLTSQTEKRITTTDENIKPSISKDTIVYQKKTVDTYADYFDIRVYDLVTGVDIYGPNAFDRKNKNPSVSGNQVVYLGKKSVYSNCIYTGYIYPRELWAIGFGENPHIDQGRIVYQDNNNIILYDSPYNSTYMVTNRPSRQVNPKINQGYIVYMDDRNGNWDIYMTESYYGGIGGPGEENEETSFPMAPLAFTLVMSSVLVVMGLFVFFRKRRKSMK
jgi:TolB protein